MNIFKYLPVLFLLCFFSCEQGGLEQFSLSGGEMPVFKGEPLNDNEGENPEPLKSATFQITTCPVEDMESCDFNGDGYCECSSSASCDKYCGYQTMAAARVGIGGRICDLISGCIPPVDLVTLRLDFTAYDPADVVALLKNKDGKIFAKGEIAGFDGKRSRVSIKLNLAEPELFYEKLYLEIKTSFINENGKIDHLHMQTDAFDEMTFVF